MAGELLPQESAASDELPLPLELLMATAPNPPWLLRVGGERTLTLTYWLLHFFENTALNFSV